MANGERPVILAVDDQPGILELFRLILEGDYDILAAPNGATALEMFHSSHVDLVLLDVNLPDTNGLDLLQQIRSQDRTVPVILVTVIDRAQPAFDARRLGANDYVTKPFNGNDLALRVERALLGARPADHALGSSARRDASYSIGRP